MRGHDHAHVDRDGAVAADALHLALLQHAQQLGLHHQRHVADFVQEERAVVGLLELAEVPRGRARERALLVAEQLGFDQLAGHGGAVQRDERAALRRGLRSCSARAISSLPVPVSPRMQTRVSLAATRSTCAMTRRMASPEWTISCLPTRWRSSRFSSSRRFSLRTLSTVSSSLSVESGFSRKSTAPSRVARTAISILACPEIITTGQRDAEVAQVFEQREPVLAGHHDVGEHHVEGLRFDQFQRARGVIADRGFVPGQAEGPRQRGQRVGIVIDNQEVCQV